MGLAHRIRFRAMLPIMFFALSIIMSRLGDAQLTRNLRAVHGARNDSAVATFVDYANNAPAWAAAVVVPPALIGDPLYGDAVYDFQRWYRAFLLVMWFLIGFQLDRWHSPVRIAPSGSSRWGKRIFAALLVFWGVCVCYAGVATARFYDLWFCVPVQAWGVGLIFVGLCPVSAAGGRARRIFFGTLLALLGVFECWAGASIYETLWVPAIRQAWLSSEITIFAWGAVLFIVGLYLLLRRAKVDSTDRRA